MSFFITFIPFHTHFSYPVTQHCEESGREETILNSSSSPSINVKILSTLWSLKIWLKYFCIVLYLNIFYYELKKKQTNQNFLVIKFAQTSFLSLYIWWTSKLWGSASDAET